jgi:DNA-binding NarL/FixJ family response regulator
VLALVADALVAAEWWGSGVHGVLERTAAPSQIISALLAIREGLRVLAPSFAPAAQRRAESIAAPLESLTPREIEVLHLMADGLSNKLIARDLSISENTVKFHVNAILSKLDAQSRTDAVVRATRMGILLL